MLGGGGGGFAAAEGAAGGRGPAGGAITPADLGGIGGIGAPGRGGVGIILTTPGGVGAEGGAGVEGAVAGEPAAGVDPGRGGVGRTFFFSSGLLLSSLDNLSRHHFLYFGLYPPLNAPVPRFLPYPTTPLWSTSQIGGTTWRFPAESVARVSSGIALVGAGC